MVTVGAAGVSDGVIAELESALDHHELVKVKIRGAGRSARGKDALALAEATGSALVQQIGHMVLLYRPDPETPAIRLPRS